MQTLLTRCLGLNLATLLAAGALLLWYPQTEGFTITGPRSTSYVSGGVFLGAILMILGDISIAGYLVFRLARGH
jgi:hypothetical protein